MRIAALSCAVLSVCLTAPASAQSSPAAAAGLEASAVDSASRPSHLAAARALLEVTHFEEIAVTAALQAFDQQVAATPEAAVFRDLVEQWLHEVFGGEDAQLAFAHMYAEVFTETDLVDLTTFYRSPLGERAAAVQPALAARGAEIGQRLSSMHQPVLEKRMRERAAALEAASTPE